MRVVACLCRSVAAPVNRDRSTADMVRLNGRARWMCIPRDCVCLLVSHSFRGLGNMVSCWGSVGVPLRGLLHGVPLWVLAEFALASSRRLSEQAISSPRFCSAFNTHTQQPTLCHTLRPWLCEKSWRRKPLSIFAWWCCPCTLDLYRTMAQ